MDKNVDKQIAELSDGERSVFDIAVATGHSITYVRNIIARDNLPKRPRGRPPVYKTADTNAISVNKHKTEIPGKHYTGAVGKDGYVIAKADAGQNGLNVYNSRGGSLIHLHRIIASQQLGRALSRDEVVVHSDGVILNNDPENILIFENRTAAAEARASGLVQSWTDVAATLLAEAIGGKPRHKPFGSRQDMQKSGNLRLLHILIAAIKLGYESEHMNCARKHLVRAGITDTSRTNLLLELKALSVHASKSAADYSAFKA